MALSNEYSEKLRQRLMRLESVSSRLQGVRDADTLSLEDATRTVSQAKARQGLHKEVVKVFEALQKRTLSRSVGVFETLLSAILKDVLPEEGSVRLIPEFKSSSASLDILLEKKSGHLEDILDGNGGAVANVLSAGLRFATLARTQNRALIVLDEPDCWLKPTRVPAFLKVIAEVSRQGYQTFFVTHHDLNSVEGMVNIVEFSRHDVTGEVTASLIPPAVGHWENDEQPGIRKIELINFGPHKHTVIPCFPGATAFTGGNNFGKSVGIGGALRAVCYGESSVGQINHDSETAQVVYHLEKGQRLEWTRYRNKSPAVMYRLYEQGNPKPLQETRQPKQNSAPEWVVELLKVTKVDELDVHLRSQKAPVYMLDESGPRRARLLNVGKESSYNDVLIKRYESMRSSDNEAIKHGEAAVMRLNFRLQAFTDFDTKMGVLAELFFQIDDVIEVSERLIAMQEAANTIERQTSQVAGFDARLATLAKTPALPVLADTSAMEHLVKTFEQHTPWAAVVVPELPAIPVLEDLSGMEDVCGRIVRATKVVEACQELPAVPALPELIAVEPIAEMGALLAKASRELNSATAFVDALSSLPAAPVLTDVTELEAQATRLFNAEKEHKRCSDALEAATAELTGILQEIAECEKSLGGVCPVCRGPLQQPHAHGATEHAH